MEKLYIKKLEKVIDVRKEAEEKYDSGLLKNY